MIARPLHSNVVIREIKPEKKYGSLIIPDSAQSRGQVGEVLAIGNLSDEHGNLPFPVDVGQKVIFARYAGHEVELEGELVLIMKASDLLAIVEDE